MSHSKKCNDIISSTQNSLSNMQEKIFIYKTNIL